MSKSVKKIVSIAAPIVGALALGPAGLGLTSAALGGAIGGAAGGLASGGGIRAAAMGGITGYLGGGAVGAPAGASLAATTGNAALQGPTLGTGLAGAVSGGGLRALTAPVTNTALSGIVGQQAGGGLQTTLLNAASGIVGDMNKDTAEEAARQQAEAIQSGINANTAALQPYNELGQNAVDRINTIQSNPAEYIRNNELYQSLSKDAERRLLANQAAKGKVGSGGTAAALQEQLLNLGSGLVNQEIGNLQTQAGLGGNAASNIGTIGYQGNTAIGNANAAGTVGANNALTSQYQNQINTILASQNVNRAPVYSQPINL